MRIHNYHRSLELLEQVNQAMVVTPLIQIMVEVHPVLEVEATPPVLAKAEGRPVKEGVATPPVPAKAVVHPVKEAGVTPLV